jgi:pantoate--beta-alanine ligase
VTVFVNPTQFNNSDDLSNYPKTEEKDIELLKTLDCDLVFFPKISDVYPDDYIFPGINLGFLDQTMEGELRPGHFQGVCQVVYRLFQLTKPNKTYFGLKDFQQVSVIRFMVNHFQLPIEITPCETSRDENGLALSSRNLRLSEEQKNEALVLYKTLSEAKLNTSKFNPAQIKSIAERYAGQMVNHLITRPQEFPLYNRALIKDGELPDRSSPFTANIVVPGMGYGNGNRRRAGYYGNDWGGLYNGLDCYNLPGS